MLKQKWSYYNSMYFTELSSLAGGGERNTAFNRKGHQALPDVLNLLKKTQPQPDFFDRLN